MRLEIQLAFETWCCNCVQDGGQIPKRRGFLIIIHTGQSPVELNYRENETCAILSTAATPSQLSPAGLPSQLLQALDR
jgi:hypothetical protein